MTEQLAVFINQQQLGTLLLEGKEDVFGLEYDPQWLAEGGYVVSPYLKPGKCQSESVKRFLSNLLPEGRWLEELAVDCRISKNNIFGLIAAIGSETTGALTFHHDGGIVEQVETSFRQVGEEELQDRLARRQDLSIANWDGKSRLSVAGVQDKLPILIKPDGKMGFGEGDLASTHILKFGTRPDMHLVINEFICMELARLVRLPVAEVSLARYGEPVLIVERFDRKWTGDRVERIHLIDGCQMLDLPPTYKYERPFGKTGEGARIRTGASLPALFKACRLCRVPALAMRELLNWVLFQLLIGNSDAHGKNISFFVGRSGMDVAPAYDLVNVEIYGERYDRDLAMAVGDTFDFGKIHAYQLAGMCDECNLPQRQMARALQSMGNLLIKAVDGFDKLDLFIGDEQAFGQGLLDGIRTNSQRFLEIAHELPDVRL
ncbi:MAG: HipA domain-containing protein [Proteobacteria bacterium]|nr:HipA domain-containing protein [Pseudomonadota bacterium]MBU1739447.1 HipA domain-containing protein [Pseudomonadota bacterium]